MDGQMKEIRQLLLGRFEREEDGCLMARPLGQRAELYGLQGVSTGWGAVHFLGIDHSSRTFQLPDKAAAGRLKDVMKALGRPVHLGTEPKLTACLMQRLMAAPVVLTARRNGAEVEAAAYTARGAASWLTCRRALTMLEKRLAED